MSVFTSYGLPNNGLFFEPPTDILGISLLTQSMISLLSLSIQKMSQTESMQLLMISQNSRSSLALINSFSATSVLIPFWLRSSLGLSLVKSTLLLQDAIRLTAFCWLRLKTRLMMAYSSIGCTREAVAVTLTPSNPLLKISTQYLVKFAQLALQV